MADYIVIGKTTFSRSAPPEVVYCGQDRPKALAAAAATGGKYPWLYFVDAGEFHRIQTPRVPAPAPTTDAVSGQAAAPEVFTPSIAPDTSETASVSHAPGKKKKSS